VTALAAVLAAVYALPGWLLVTAGCVILVAIGRSVTR